MYPHLVGWISQYWYIPTWLGDWCMYESLWRIESCSSCRTCFCRPCLQSGGAWTAHFSRAEISACTQWEHGQIGTLWHIQRGSSIRDFSKYSGGVWTAECISRKRITWFALCPRCQRGRVTWYGCCHQVQRGRLLALWCMCCTWWQPTCSRTSYT